MFCESSVLPHEPQGLIPPVLPFHLVPPTCAASLTVAPLTCSFPQFVKAARIVQRYRNKRRRKNSNPSKSRDPVAMKECGKSKERSRREIDLRGCEGDSQCIEFPRHHQIVLCPFSLSYPILPGLSHTRSFPVGLVRSVTKKNTYQWN